MVSEDSYGRGPVRREMTAFRGDVRSGNSGGPVVNGNGEVETTVFAASTEKGPPSGLGVPNAIVERGIGNIGGTWAPGPARPEPRAPAPLSPSTRLCTLEPRWRSPLSELLSATVPAPEGARGKVCPEYHAAVELVGRRWTGAILWSLIERPHYFAELKSASPGSRTSCSRSDCASSRRRAWSTAPSTRARRRASPTADQKGRDVEPAVGELRDWARRWK